MPSITQLRVGAAQFDGMAGAGLFSFSSFERIPQTSRIVVHRLSYHAETGGNPGTAVEFYFEHPSDPLNRVLIGRGLAPDIVGPAGDADFGVCGGVVPRTATGAHWSIRAISAGKTVDARVTCDYTPTPLPHTSERDSIS